MACLQVYCATVLLAFGLAAGVDLDCPPLWTRYGDHCYRFFGPPKTWQAAEDHCQEFFTRNGQGHLASIHTSGENKFLLQMWKTSLVPTNTIYVRDHVWLGQSDQLEEGNFSWSDGTGLYYKAWRGGQPNNAGGAEDCGSFWEINDEIGWNDDDCDVAMPYLCKMPSNKE